MTRIGITGHQILPQEAAEFAERGIRAILSNLNQPVVGVSSLAAGADQLFAREIISSESKLHAVIPADGYADTFTEVDRLGYFELLGRASEITQLGFPTPTEEAYASAGYWIADHCDIMVAVWDGEPARGLGGTADAVAYARRAGRDVKVLWPRGLQRE